MRGNSVLGLSWCGLLLADLLPYRSKGANPRSEFECEYDVSEAARRHELGLRRHALPRERTRLRGREGENRLEEFTNRKKKLVK